MSALSTVTSQLTESTTEKKAEEGYGRIVPASGGLHVITEDGDADEAANVAGDIAQTFTADEEDAVRRKLDRRILPLLASIYFSQYLDKNSKRPPFLDVYSTFSRSSGPFCRHQLRLRCRRLPYHRFSLHHHRGSVLRRVLRRRDPSVYYISALSHRAIVSPTFLRQRHFRSELIADPSSLASASTSSSGRCV